MQALIVKLKQEVYVLRQKLIVTNGSSLDKNLKSVDAEALEDKQNDSKDAEAAAEKETKKGTEKVDRTSKAATTAKTTTAAKKDTKDTAAAKDTKKKTPTTAAGTSKQSKPEPPKLSIDTKREQVKAMLAQTQVAQPPYGELEVVEEESAPADGPN